MDKLYTTKEVAEILRTTDDTIQSMCRDGRIRAIKINSSWLISESSLNDVINGKKETTENEYREKLKTLQAKRDYEAFKVGLDSEQYIKAIEQIEKRNNELLEREQSITTKETELTDREVALSALEAQVRERNTALLNRVAEFEASIEARTIACEKQCKDMIEQANQRVKDADEKCNEFNEAYHIKETIANKKVQEQWDKEHEPKKRGWL